MLHTITTWHRQACGAYIKREREKERERERENSIPQSLPRAYPPFSCTTGACSRNLTEGDSRCQKRQQIEEKKIILKGKKERNQSSWEDCQPSLFSQTSLSRQSLWTATAGCTDYVTLRMISLLCDQGRGQNCSL
jgi:hypothetical protein